MKTRARVLGNPQVPERGTDRMKGLLALRNFIDSIREL